jgi:hypothetical protein
MVILNKYKILIFFSFIFIIFYFNLFFNLLILFFIIFLIKGKAQNLKTTNLVIQSDSTSIGNVGGFFLSIYIFIFILKN